MAAEEILKLFDAYWSEKSIFKPSSKFLETLEKDDQEKLQEPGKRQDLLPLNLQVSRSLSDRILLMNCKTSFLGSRDDLFTPKSLLDLTTAPKKLQTIVSGKEVNEFSSDNESFKQERDVTVDETEKKREDGKRRRKKKGTGSSKSLSDLEYEELKGFMDLGFVFSEEDHKNSRLVSIVPGLQRLGGKNEEKRRKDIGVSRPYLSEVWGVWEERKGEKTALMNWKIPAPENEIDLKEHLRLWAHTVASTVR